MAAFSLLFLFTLGTKGWTGLEWGLKKEEKDENRVEHRTTLNNK